MESGDLPGRRAGSGADNGFHIIERDLLCCNRENMGQTVSCAFSGQKWKKLDAAVDLNNESGQEAELVQEDGKVYLMIDGRRAADITDDFADGKAVGTIQLNITDETLENDSGEKTFYKVTGDMDDYNITLKQGDKAAARADSTEE